MTSKKFKNKYSTDSFRAQFWDYSSPASYFISICTKNRETFFGRIQDTRVILSPIGEIADSCWYEIPLHFPMVKLGAHVIMPNHVHGIITIKPKTGEGEFDKNVEAQHYTPPRRKNRFGSQSRNLASIVHGFKVG